MHYDENDRQYLRSNLNNLPALKAYHRAGKRFDYKFYDRDATALQLAVEENAGTDCINFLIDYGHLSIYLGDDYTIPIITAIEYESRTNVMLFLDKGIRIEYLTNKWKHDLTQWFWAVVDSRRCCKRMALFVTSICLKRCFVSRDVSRLVGQAVWNTRYDDATWMVPE